MTPREALAGVALLAMDADGVLVADEDDDLRLLLLDHPAFESVDDDELGRVLAAAEKHVRKAGSSAFLDEARMALDEDGRASAFAIAADIVCADDVLEGEEAVYLAQLASGLGVAEAVMDEVLAQLGVTRAA